MFKLYFRILVLISVALYVFWFYLPHFISHGYSPETFDALTWSGYGAKFSWQILNIANYGLFVAYGVICLGLIYFKPWSRIAFLWLTILSLISTFAFGISILTEPDAFLLQIMYTIDGFILAVIYFSGLSKEYDLTHNKSLQSDASNAGAAE